MAFYLSMWWLAGTAAYFYFVQPGNLTPLAIVFFGTTFFALPSCILGGFTALGLLYLQRPLHRRLNEPQAIMMGISVGVLAMLTVLLLSEHLFPFCPPKAVAGALYLAFCGRISSKIYELLSHQTL